jgi:VIT1/CCC1 family predicted Fe2+/Mn2+ transporter
MMHHELQMIKPSKSPFAVGLATFTSFGITGSIPLILYIVDWLNPLHIDLFSWASMLTFFTFAFIGFLKGKINETAIGKSIIETIGLGVAAAILAYFAGDILEALLN